MSTGRPRVLMPVYNSVVYDGRVQRAAAALGRRYDVIVLAVDAGRPFTDPDYRVRTVRLPDVGGKAGMHLRFLGALLRQAAALRPAVVHAHDFFMAGPGLAAARLCGARLVYDAHELIVPEPDLHQTRRDRFFYVLERLAVRRADLVIAANQPRAEIMREHYGLPATPLVIGNIPRAPDPEARAGPAANGNGTGGDAAPVRLVYQGDMSLERGVGDFVTAMRRLPRRFELLLVGGGPDLEALREMARRERVTDRVRFAGRVPRSELHGILRECHIGVITYPRRGLNNVYCAPNKLFEYAQAGLPMVGSDNPVLRAAFTEHGVGVAGGDPADAVLAVAADLPRFQAALPAFVRRHRWEDEADRLLDGYASLLGGAA